MTAANVVSYAWMDLGPGQIQKYLADIEQSGVDTIVLWAMHIGTPLKPDQQFADLIYNDPPVFVRGGKFNPFDSPEVAAWPAQIAELKKNGSVKKVFFSIGGASQWVQDFRTIEYLQQYGADHLLLENFRALREAFTVDGVCVIDGFDIDSEEDLRQFTIPDFCRMLFGLGFEVTFCPYGNPESWAVLMKDLWDIGYKVSWWNLQCYAGGDYNPKILDQWVKALSSVVGEGQGANYLVPGLAVAGTTDSGPKDPKCPSAMQEFFLKNRKLGLAGGFLWHYDFIVKNTDRCGDSVPKLGDYVKAIRKGLGDPAGA